MMTTIKIPQLTKEIQSQTLIEKVQLLEMERAPHLTCHHQPTVGSLGIHLPHQQEQPFIPTQCVATRHLPSRARHHLVVAQVPPNPGGDLLVLLAHPPGRAHLLVLLAHPPGRAHLLVLLAHPPGRAHPQPVPLAPLFVVEYESVKRTHGIIQANKKVEDIHSTICHLAICTFFYHVKIISQQGFIRK
jgi:phosphohistidine phosphatase SixA